MRPTIYKVIWFSILVYFIPVFVERILITINLVHTILITLCPTLQPLCRHDMKFSGLKSDEKIII